MTTTTLRAAVARVHAVFALIDWQEAFAIAADGLRILWAITQLLLTALVLTREIAHEHRQQIRQTLVTCIAAAWLAAIWTYRAGCRARRWWAALLGLSERLGRWYAALVAPASDEAQAPSTAAPEEPVALVSLSNRELRELLGIRRHLSKRRLLELAAAA